MQPDVTSGSRTFRGEVVDGRSADGREAEIGLHPGRDVRTGTRIRARSTAEPTGDEIADVSVGHVLLELRERGRRITTGEAADRHDRLVRAQDEPGRRLRAD